MRVALMSRTLIKKPLDAVWTFFGDIPQVAACLPGADLTNQVGEHRYEGDVIIKAGAVKPPPRRLMPLLLESQPP